MLRQAAAARARRALARSAALSRSSAAQAGQNVEAAGATAGHVRWGAQVQGPPPPLPFNMQVLQLGTVVVGAAAGAAWLTGSKIAKVESELRRFEGATTATLAHHSAQLAQLQQQGVQFGKQLAQLQQQYAQVAQLQQQLLQAVLEKR